MLRARRTAPWLDTFDGVEPSPLDACSFSEAYRSQIGQARPGVADRIGGKFGVDLLFDGRHPVEPGLMRGSTAGMKFAAMIRDRWPPIELVLVSSQPRMERDVPERSVLFGKPFEEREIVATLQRMAS